MEKIRGTRYAIITWYGGICGPHGGPHHALVDADDDELELRVPATFRKGVKRRLIKLETFGKNWSAGSGYIWCEYAKSYARELERRRKARRRS